MYAVCDRIFDVFPAKVPCMHRICMVLANPIYLACVRPGCVSSATCPASFYLTAIITMGIDSQALTLWRLALRLSPCLSTLVLTQLLLPVAFVAFAGVPFACPKCQ